MLKKLIFLTGLFLLSSQLSNAQIEISPPVSAGFNTSSCTNGWVLYKSSGDPCESAFVYDASSNTLTVGTKIITQTVTTINGNSINVTTDGGGDVDIFGADAVALTSNPGNIYIDGGRGVDADQPGAALNFTSGPSTLGLSGNINLVIANGGSGSGYIRIGGNAQIDDGKALSTDTTAAHTALFQAYDVNAAAYSTACTLTNSNTPSFNCTPVGDLTIDMTANDLHLTGTTQTLTGSEVIAPAAPSSNGFKIYSQDSGGGKTQVCARFASGAVQCFATEP